MLGAQKSEKKSALERLKLDQKNNKLIAKIVFVARCDMHLDIS